MKKVLSLVAMVMMVLALQACGEKSNLEKLDGKWNCDLKASVKAMAGGAEVNEQMLDQMGTVFKDMNITFDAGKKEVIMTFAGQTHAAPFSVEGEKDNVITLKIENQNSDIAIEKNDKGEEMIGFVLPGSGLVQKVYFTKSK